MNKQIVVTKKDIEQTLLNGGCIDYDTWEAKAVLMNNKREVIGTIRFNTYLQLNISMEALKQPNPVFYKEHQPWSLHEYYYINDLQVDKKRIWRY